MTNITISFCAPDEMATWMKHNEDKVHNFIDSLMDDVAILTMDGKIIKKWNGY